MNISKVLNILMYKYGFKVKEVAKRLDVSRDSILNWTNGVVPRNPIIFCRISSEFNVDMNENTNDKKLLTEICRINNKHWGAFILGLMHKLNLNQTGLSKLLGFKDYNPIISGWINKKNNPTKYMKFKLVEAAKRHGLSSQELILDGNFIQGSVVLPDGNRITSNNAVYKKIISEKLILNKNNKVFINSIMLLPNNINNKYIKIIKYIDKIVVFYKNNSRSQPKPLVLPRFMLIHKDFLVGLGIYLAEGSKNRNPKVTNSEPFIINQSIKFFKLFGIRKFRAWIQLHERSNKSFNQVKRFWLSKIESGSTKITKIILKKSRGTADIENYGVIHLEASFILLRYVIERLLKKVKFILNNIPDYLAIYFLRGAFAGEGSVGMVKNTVRSISYTSIKDNERKIISKLLKKFNVISHEDKANFQIRFFGFSNLDKLNNLDIFKYHPERRRKLGVGIANLKQSKIPGLNKNRIVNLLKTNETMKTSEISEILGLSYKNTLKHLYGLQRSGSVKKIRMDGICYNWLCS